MKELIMLFLVIIPWCGFGHVGYKIAEGGNIVFRLMAWFTTGFLGTIVFLRCLIMTLEIYINSGN